MTLLKRAELVGKTLGALVAALLLWRPWRRIDPEALRRARRILLVRLDDRVGEALLATPLLAALAALPEPPKVDVLVHAKVVRVLEGHPLAARVLGFDRRKLFLGPWAPGIRAVRRAGYDVVVSCANWEAATVSQSIVARLIAGRAPLVGPRVFPAGLLASVPVAPLRQSRSEVAQRQHLLSPLGVADMRHPLSFRGPRVKDGFAQWLAELPRPLAVVNPGGRLGWRRVPPEVFAAAAQGLWEAGALPVVTFGPGEEALAKEVVAACQGAHLALPTDLDELAALLGAAEVCVCNNTGPMHLSVAVGTPTLALFKFMEVARWGHGEPPHQMLDLTHEPEPQGLVRAQAAAFLSRSRRERAGTSALR
jgi:heptosyltransferase III